MSLLVARALFRSLLVGKPVIIEKDACDRLRSTTKGGAKAKAIPRETWRSVMEAGLADCKFIMLQKSATGKDWKLCLQQMPSTSLDKILYHNELMTLCGLSLRELSEAMNKTSTRVKDAAPTAKNRAAATGGGHTRSCSRSH